jgi:hypothetical protein
MNQELQTYLNDHMAGASAALLVLSELIDQCESQGARDLMEDLKERLEADRSRLGDLLLLVGKEPSITGKIAGQFTGRVGALKFMWDRVEPGGLGFFEALEMLALGIQGKRLLWRTLHEISAWIPEWHHVDFPLWEREAVQQRDSVERWRLEAACKTFIGKDAFVSQDPSSIYNFASIGMEHLPGHKR